MASRGASRRRRLLPHRLGVCPAGQQRAIVATLCVGCQRVLVCRAYRIRALSTAQLTPSGCIAHSRGGCDRGNPSCSCRHGTFASEYIDDWAQLAPGTCCVASCHGYSGICGRLRRRGSTGTPSVVAELAEHRCPLVSLWSLCLFGLTLLAAEKLYPEQPVSKLEYQVPERR